MTPLSVEHRPHVVRRDTQRDPLASGLCPRPFQNLLHGDCSQPIGIVLSYRREAVPEYPAATRATDQLCRSELWVRCRKCEECLCQRTRCWIARAMTEVENCSGRTWVSALTFSRSKIPASAKLVEWCQRQLTLYFKRLRKLGCSFRYLAVMELQADGTPHFHVLLHERTRSSVSWKHLDTWSSLGFHKSNLLRGANELKAVAYACKYITKHKFSRIRASLSYGHSLALSQRQASEAQRETGLASNRLLTDTPLSPPPSPFSFSTAVAELRQAIKLFAASRGPPVFGERD